MLVSMSFLFYGTYGKVLGKVKLAREMCREEVRGGGAELKSRDDIPLLLGVKSSFKHWFRWNLPPYATHRLANR
jgi:hypothetical protein